MSSTTLVDVLKRDLKARGITYAALARGIGLSEATVKRMFARKDMTLSRIDRICAFAGIEFAELTRGIDRDARLLDRLTDAQERELVANPKLFLVATCALNSMTLEDVLRTYRITPAECIQMLVRLERIGFIDLMQRNRIKLRVARTFGWIPDGPIVRFFREQATDYLASTFAGTGETMLVVTGRLSPASQVQLQGRLRRVAREFADQHAQEARLPFEERMSITLLLAARPWEPKFMRELRRDASGSGKRLPLSRRPARP